MTVVEFEKLILWYQNFDWNSPYNHLTKFPHEVGWWKITKKEREVIRALDKGQQ